MGAWRRETSTEPLGVVSAVLVWVWPSQGHVWLA